MIELKKRQEILRMNNTFASFLTEWQRQVYDPTTKENTYVAGEIYDDQHERYYTPEEVNNMNRERLDDYRKKQDHLEVDSQEHKYKGCLIYKLPDAPIGRYVKGLSEVMEGMQAALNWKSVLFLHDYAEPWLGQENDYAPVVKAMNYLRSIGVTNDFAGGFVASGKDLRDLTKHLFWITRCNASIPDSRFSAIGRKFAADICKRGNFHFYAYSNTEKNLLHKKALELGLIPLEYCYEHLSNSRKGAVKGRQPGW